MSAGGQDAVDCCMDDARIDVETDCPEEAAALASGMAGYVWILWGYGSADRLLTLVAQRPEPPHLFGVLILEDPDRIELPYPGLCTRSSPSLE